MPHKNGARRELCLGHSAKNPMRFVVNVVDKLDGFVDTIGGQEGLTTIGRGLIGFAPVVGTAAHVLNPSENIGSVCASVLGGTANLVGTVMAFQGNSWALVPLLASAATALGTKPDQSLLAYLNGR